MNSKALYGKMLSTGPYLKDGKSCIGVRFSGWEGKIGSAGFK